MSPTEQIDNQIANLTDWRGEFCAKIRQLIQQAAPEVKEDWKWGTAVWTANGNVCAMGAFKDHVKVNFFKGASLPDPDKLFNSGLEAKATRAIDFFENDPINEAAFQDLVRAAIAQNKK